MKNRKNPSLSVIMGIYNEKNLTQVKAAIDSILNQAWDDFEFIICDDGSDKSLYNWLCKYCQKNSRIQIIRNKSNMGLAMTLNHCLKYAKGKYIARMDADDISVPERFEKQIHFLEKNTEYAMVGSNARLIDEENIWGRRIMPEKPEKKDFLKNSPFIHPSMVFRADALRQLHGYSNQNYALRTEDYELFMRAYSMGMRGYNLQECLILYREDKNAYKKRKYRYRICEYHVRKKGFQSLGIYKGNFRYVVKPLIVGLIPKSVLRLRKFRIGKKQL